MTQLHITNYPDLKSRIQKPICVLCDNRIESESQQTRFEDAILGCEYEVHTACKVNPKAVAGFNDSIARYRYANS